VIADDEEAAPGELLAEVIPPGDHLRPEAHDQQQRRVGAVAERLVAELDPVDVRELLAHLRRSSTTTGILRFVRFR
jgi:hypothetical protein